MEPHLIITIEEAEVSIRALLKVQGGLGKLNDDELKVLISLINKLNF